MYFSCRVEPLLVCVSIPGVASFVVMSRGAVDPLVAFILMSVSAVVVAVAYIVSMFRTVVSPLEPLVPLAVYVNNSFIRCSCTCTWCPLAGHGGSRGCNGIL